MDGMTVLDLTANVAGPLACQVLGDLGARVIKVEPAEGEAARRIVATRDGMTHLRPYFAPNNRGKLSALVDLTTAEGVADLLRLADEADVFVVGFRPGVCERLGIGVDAVRARNPRCVYASLSAYGADSDRPGIDMLVQAETGLTTGLRRDGAPTTVASQIVDACSGHVLAQAVLGALLGRERTGEGDHVSVAMYDVACSMQSNHLTMRLNTPPGTDERTAKEGIASVAVAPSGVFRTGDGYLVLAAYVPKHWRLLCAAIDRPDLLEDPRFTDQAQRTRHMSELFAILEETFAAAPAADWEQRLQAAGVMAVRANSWGDVVSSPTFAQRGVAVPAESEGVTVTTIRTPARYAGFDPPGDRHLPALGEHTSELL
jgi:crotonobetainyl-CoA:carnitine CoA-transferase CaiB-like acyl-CoA transferase